MNKMQIIDRIVIFYSVNYADDVNSELILKNTY
jgi:hypothetical protein